MNEQLKQFTGDCLPTFFINLYKKNYLGKAAKTVFFYQAVQKQIMLINMFNLFYHPQFLLKHTVLQSHCYKLIRIPIHVFPPPAPFHLIFKSNIIRKVTGIRSHIVQIHDNVIKCLQFLKPCFDHSIFVCFVIFIC